MRTIEKEIRFDGNYWWGTEKEVIEPLLKELTRIINSSRISTIEICATDFNDGRENRTFKISVDDLGQKIVIKEMYYEPR